MAGSTEHGADSDHPQQGKIERWHQTLKNRVRLVTYYVPVGSTVIVCFITAAPGAHQRRARQSTPADVYFERGKPVARLAR